MIVKKLVWRHIKFERTYEKLYALEKFIKVIFIYLNEV